MILGILKPILQPLLNPTIPAAPAATPSRAATTSTGAVVPAAAASQQTIQQAAETPLVAASPQQGSAAAQTEGVKFDLSDKALQRVAAAAANQSSDPASAPASAEPVAAVSETAADRPAEAADPSEEDRARAWAIRGMEREKLLNLVDILKVTPKADPAQKEVAEHAAAQPSVQAAPASQPGAA
ncbi:hypothetical protein [Paracoccus sp. S3-43]|uniref:hypothetical protein n=1 Tax=Paracoccus sp. S3-43 TaxID=3030011 RepID=UPI0023B094C7|nr:hypothetical protein [Paracoccus sp. S3-43]WEF24016.1 hypothetical protein PXD02_14690 [Paracoccus sp. S3-43]